MTSEEIASWINQGLQKLNTPEGSEHGDRMYDYEKLAEKFRSDPDSMKTTIDNLEAEFKADLPDEPDKTIRALVMRELVNLNAMVSPEEYLKKNADQFDGVILGVSNKKDLNYPEKKMAWNAYKKDPEKAIADGKVRIEIGEDGKEKQIALISKKKFQSGKDNPDFGEPIPYAPGREMFMVLMESTIGGMVTDGNEQICLVRADYDDVNVGQISTIRGKSTQVANKLHTAVIRGWENGYSEAGSYKKAWDLANRFYEKFYVDVRSGTDGDWKTDRVTKMTLDQVRAMPGFGFFCTKANVQKVELTSDKEIQKLYLNLESDGTTVTLSTKYSPLFTLADDLSSGDEVIVTGERFSYKKDDGTWVKANTLMGAIRNPEGGGLSDALKKLEEIRAARNSNVGGKK